MEHIQPSWLHAVVSRQSPVKNPVVSEQNIGYALKELPSL
jgi:hypothetical protein